MPDENLDSGSDADILEKLQEEKITVSSDHDQRILQAAKAFSTASSNWWPAAIAALVLVGIVGVVFLPQYQEMDNTVRSLPDKGITPAPGSLLKSPPSEFAWHAPESLKAPQSCQLELRNPRAEIIWTSAWGKTSTIELPKAVQTSLDTKTLYTWIVRCQTESLLEYGPFTFLIL